MKLLEKIKGELLNKDTQLSITGGYRYGGCRRCTGSFPPHGTWIAGCGYVYWDSATSSFCKP